MAVLAEDREVPNVVHARPRLFSHQMYRPGANAATSNGGGAPDIIAAIASPVAGPVVKPMCWLPKASQRLRCRGAGPIIGRLSGRVGRAPRQVSPTCSPNSTTPRASGSTASICEKFDGASRVGQLDAAR